MSRRAIDRRPPQWSELVRFVGPALRPDPRARWTRIVTTDDFERLARRRTPKAVFDYVAGAAEQERTARSARAAFDSVVLHPHVLRDVTVADPSATVLGRPVAFPAVLGPTGFTRMMRAEGEPAVARAAARAGLPYTLSTLGTTSVEELTAAAPDTDRWLQLYVWRDRARAAELLARAREAQFRVLVLTVDVPVAGARQRDSRNGLTVPPRLSPRTLLDMARHVRWTFDALTTEPLSFASLGEADDVQALLSKVFDPAVTLDDIEWLRSQWPGPIVVKGVQRVDDAKAIAAAGVDGIAVSNHGGRQLDRSIAPLRLLPDVAEAVGDQVEVYLDGGVRSGADIAVSLALGAHAVFIARPYLYALMALGEPGVDHLLGVLRTDYVRTLQLLGVTRGDQLDRDLVSLG